MVSTVDDINSMVTADNDTTVLATFFFPMAILISVRNEIKMKKDAAEDLRRR